MTSTFRRSPLALAILAILGAEPLHPYGIQRRIKEWGKDTVVNVGDRSSLYKMINRLERADLIAATGTDRDPSYPERTTYRITDAGESAAAQWLGEIISTPRNEYPEFPAALSFAAMLTSDMTRTLLTSRLGLLAAHLAELDAELATEVGGHQLPRINLLDAEYQRAITAAELDWTNRILGDLKSQDLTWSREQLIQLITFGTEPSH